MPPTLSPTPSSAAEVGWRPIRQAGRLATAAVTFLAATIIGSSLESLCWPIAPIALLEKSQENYQKTSRNCQKIGLAGIHLSQNSSSRIRLNFGCCWAPNSSSETCHQTLTCCRLRSILHIPSFLHGSAMITSGSFFFLCSHRARAVLIWAILASPDAERAMDLRTVKAACSLWKVESMVEVSWLTSHCSVGMLARLGRRLTGGLLLT